TELARFGYEMMLCKANDQDLIKELEARKQLSETSSSLTQTVQQLQTDKRYWSKGEKCTLRECFLGYLGFERNFVHKLLNNMLFFFAKRLKELKNRYVAFLSLHQS
ncbi:hypothetical protein cypCar_00003512, partial [Cyprinus carpio]